MKRGDLVFKIVAGVFFVAIAAYLGFYLIRSAEQPFKTSPALSYTVYDSINITGLVIRDEVVLSSGYDIIYISAEEGKAVAAGSTVAVAYASSADLQTAEHIRELEIELAYLQKLRAANSAQSDGGKLDRQIKDGILSLRTSLQKGETTKYEQIGIEIGTLAFSRSFSQEELDSRIAMLNEELYRLGTPSSQAIMTAPCAGIFSRAVDGWETDIPDIDELNTSSLSHLLSTERGSRELAYGKLVKGSKWYYATAMRSKDIAGIDEGDTVMLIFDRYYNQKLEMTVERIEEDYSGGSLVVFSCGTAMRDTLSLRRTVAEFIKTEYSGIKVPSKAVHVDENGQTFVYVVTGLRAERKNVEIAFELEGHYIINQDYSSGALRIGDSIIVSAKNMYDGKVVG